jgi:predicted RecA/RadA family phage recombinase
MANLTHTQPRNYQVLPTAYLDYPMAASTTIYEGSALSDTGSATTATGVAETLVAGENFLGFANGTVTTGSSVGTINVIAEGVIQLAVTGVTAASTGAEVYASDGSTFTLTSTSNTPVGKVIKIVSGTTVLVKFQGIGLRSI